MDHLCFKQSVTITLLLSSLISVMAETYYVTPNSTTPCPQGGEPCLTISQYATKPSNYFASNVSLILLPGNHSLEVDLRIRKLTNLKLSVQTTSNTSLMESLLTLTDVNVRCNPPASFAFQEIVQIEMNGIDFFECTSIHVTSMDQFTLDSCNFYGEGRDGTGLVLSGIVVGTIISSSFHLHTGIETAVNNNTVTTGGAMSVTNGSNISIHGCWFEGNVAEMGGAIYSEESSLGLYNSTFHNNGIITTDSANGSVISAIFSTVIVHNSTFTKNHVVANYFVYGGAMYTYYSVVTVTNSKFSNNDVTSKFVGYSAALYCESSEVIICHSTFNKNSLFSANYSLGGAVYSTFSSVTLNNNTFTDNSVFAYNHNGFGGAACSVNDVAIAIHQNRFYNNRVTGIVAYGGAVYGSNSTMKTSNSTFTGNSVTAHQNGYGGAAECELGTLTINNCDFMDNTVSGNSGFGGAVGSSYSTVTVSDSRFITNSAKEGSGGSGGALNALHTNITINRCSFDHNNVHSVNIGQGGAVSIGYSSITINESTFDSNNIANKSLNSYGGAISATNSSVVLSSSIFSSNLVVGRSYAGGGAVYTFSGSMTLIRTTFIHNNATSNIGYGGAMYVFSTDVTSHCFLDFYNNTADLSVMYAVQSTLFLTGNTTFEHNKGSLFAFSSNVTFDGLTNMSYNSKVYDNSTNAIVDGGAVTSFQSSIAFAGSTYLTFNSANMGGAILATESKLYVYGDITIANNTASMFGGGIYIYQSSLQFLGSTKSYITMNRSGKRGGGINAVGSIIWFSNGTLYITENSAERGGGMCLDLNARLYILKNQPEFISASQYPNAADPNLWLRLEFNSNRADYGGAFYVSDATNSANCAAFQTTESECFIQTLALHPYDRPNLNLLNTYFTNNTARVTGQTIYGGLLDRCAVSIFSEIFNKYYDVPPTSISAITYLLNITNLNFTEESSESNRQVSSESVRVCFCSNDQPDCSYRPPDLLVKKGQTFRVPMVAVDQTNNTVVAKIDSTLSSPAGGLGEGQTTQATLNKCTELNFTVFSPHDSEQILLNTRGPCRDIGISQNHLDVNFLPCDYCPIGFQATPYCDCHCDPLLIPTYVINCSKDTESVLRRENVWISYTNGSGYIMFPHCPFDYCLPSATFVNLNTPNGSDEQCTFNRTGKLCGSCRDGLSLTLGSSRCTSCSNKWLALLILFAIAGIALVAFLLAFNLTVAVGTINGLIFYANIIGANRAIFLPYDGPNILTVFIAWLNLDFGFETCFAAGLDGYIKTWLQLVFPTYLVFLVIMIIVVSQHSQKFARLLSKRNPVATLATLILLSYAKLIRIIITSLSYATLEYSDDTHETVWLVDANLYYLKGKHIPLFITAFFILIIGLLYSFLLFFWQWFLRCPRRRGLRWIRNTKFHSFMDAYCAPYTTKHRYWTGLLLLVRAMLYIIFAFNVVGDPGINLLSIICVAGSLLVLMALLKDKVYKNWLLYALETLFIFNVILFSAVTLYVRQSNQYEYIKTVPANVSVTVALTTFLAVLIYHICVYFAAKHLNLLLTKLAGKTRKKSLKILNKGSEKRNLVERGNQFNQLREPLSLITSVSSFQEVEEPSNQPKSSHRAVATHTVISGIPTQ